MKKDPIFKWLFSPVIGVLTTITLMIVEINYPLRLMVDVPKDASWIDVALFYWVYFVMYNLYFYVRGQFEKSRKID